MTHAKVSIDIRPRWAKGKSWSYQSALPGADLHEEPTVSASDTDNSQGSMADPDQSTPRVRRRVLQQQPVNTSSCRICGAGNGDDVDKGMWWVGCSQRVGRKSCDYWVHQKCIGLKCRTKRVLKEVPYYCPTHV